MTSQRQAAIVNSYSSKNFGDLVITVTTGNLLKELGYNTTVLTRYLDEDESLLGELGFNSDREVVRFRSRTSNRSFVRVAEMLLSSACTLLSAKLRQYGPPALRRSMYLNKALRCVANSHVTCLSGGGYFYSAKSRLSMTLFHHCVQTRVVSLVSPHTLMMPQSIGPFTRRFDRRLVAWSLKDVSVVTREEISSSCALALGLVPTEVPDVAFAFESVSPEAASVEKDGVAVVPMDWRWSCSLDNIEERFDRYQGGLVSIMSDCLAAERRTILLGFSTLDHSSQNDLDAVEGLLPEEWDVTAVAPRGVDEMVGVIRNLDAVVGTRLHSCILSLALGTPALHLSYQPKGIGTYRLLGLEHLCFDATSYDPRAVSIALETLDAEEIHRAVARARLRVRDWFSSEMAACW